MRINTLRFRLAAALLLAATAGALLHEVVIDWPRWQAWLSDGGRAPWAAWVPGGTAIVVMAVVVAVLLALWLAERWMAPLRRLLRSLETAVLSYRDGDFSVSIAADHHDELGELVRQHNALGHALRDQRQHLAQRELLLDTVVQNTPVALVLTDTRQRVAYANIAARQLGAGVRE